MAFLFEIIRLGLKNLRLHMLRSILTSLGIIFGVAAVIVMVSIGEGKKQAALREIQALGATNIIVRSVPPPQSTSFGGEQNSFVASYGLLREDLRRVEHFITDAAWIVPLKSVGDEVSRGANRMLSQAFGTTPDLLEVANLEIARGRYLSQQDMDTRAPVAVIGAEVADKFFALEDPVGEEFRISQDIFRVVGVLKPVGLAGGAGSALVGRDLNKDIHIPLTTASMRFGDIVQRRTSGSFSGEEVQVSEIYVAAQTNEQVTATAERVRRIIDQTHADERDAQLIVPWELLKQAERETRTMNIMLTAIAAISLLVGGIGIMNIMLASVTERTKEIGIRRAVGATRQHITAQFLVETGALSAVGGLLGIALGVGLSVGIDAVLPLLARAQMLGQAVTESSTFETQVTTWSIVVSFIVATGVGLIFGIYPAIVASRQDPIVALRHD